MAIDACLLRILGIDEILADKHWLEIERAAVTLPEFLELVEQDEVERRRNLGAELPTFQIRTEPFLDAIQSLDSNCFGRCQNTHLGALPLLIRVLRQRGFVVVLIRIRWPLAYSVHQPCGPLHYTSSDMNRCLRGLGLDSRRNLGRA